MMGIKIANIVAVTLSIIVLLFVFIAPHMCVNELYANTVNKIDDMERLAKDGKLDDAMEIAEQVYKEIDGKLEHLRLFINQDLIFELKIGMMSAVMWAQQGNEDMFLGAIYDLRVDIETLNEQENPTISTIL